MGLNAQRPRATTSTCERSLALEHAFSPKCIAIIGASGIRGKWSNDVFRLLKNSFKGELFPVNASRATVEGIPAYPSIAAVPQQVDYVLIVVPRAAVPKAVEECVIQKVPVVHVLSAGFAEVTEVGAALQQRLVEAVAGSKTVLIGPNAMGTYSARAGLTFAWDCHFEPGSLSFVSQSGGLCYDVLLRGQARGLAFGKILSVGNCADLDWPDYVHYFACDPQTSALALYIENVQNGRRLFEELGNAAKVKPIFVLKGGKTRGGSQAVVSHTGRLAGEYEVWKAMLRQAGAIELASLDELLIALQACMLSNRILEDKQALSAFDTMVIGTGGGATVLVTDACEAAGINLASLEQSTIRELHRIVPDAASLGGIGNPLEIGSDRLLANPDLLAQMTEIACADGGVRAVVIHVNLIGVANNLIGGIERWTTACERLAGIANWTGKLICVVLRNGDAGDKPTELRRIAMSSLRLNRDLPVFTDVLEALSLIRHSAIACQYAVRGILE